MRHLAEGAGDSAGGVRGSAPPQFGAVAPFYDSLMRDVPYRAWMNYLRRVMALRRRRVRRGARALDLACGTGNLTELLAEAGYAVTGVDISEAMIVEARKKAVERRLPIRYVVQDAAELNLEPRRYGLCVSLFDSLNYVLEPARLAGLMCRVADHLVRRGLFIFDLNTEFALQNSFFDQDNLGTSDRLQYDWDSEFLPEARLCRIRMLFRYREEDGRDREFEEVHWQYAYQEEEVVAMLSAAGFEDIATYNAYTLNPPGPTSDRVFYVATRG